MASTFRYGVDRGEPSGALPIHSNTPHGKLVRLPDDLMHFFPKGTTMCRQGVGDDGSCFYHTMAAGLNFDDWQHQASRTNKDRIGLGLRKGIKDATTTELWNDFWASKGVLPQTMKLPKWSTVEKEMARPSKWADVFHIIYTIHLLGINLIVFDFESGVIYCGTHSSSRAKTCPTFLMAWVGRTHFEPIFEVRDDGKAYGTFLHDDNVLKHVLAKYEEQGCPKVSLYHILSLRK